MHFRDAFLNSSNKYLYLLVVLLCLLILHPQMEDNAAQMTIFNVLVSLMLVISIAIFGINHRYRLIGFSLAVPEFILLWWDLFHPSLMTEFFKFAFFIPFHILAILAIYRDLILAQKKVTADEIRGAVCLFILIGATWSAVYYLIEIASPGAFYIALPSNIDGQTKWSDMLYFSFTTLSSVGYGDITPVQPLPRSLSIIESTMGLFYVAVVVAKLVTQFTAESLAANIVLHPEENPDGAEPISLQADFQVK